MRSRSGWLRWGGPLRPGKVSTILDGSREGVSGGETLRSDGVRRSHSPGAGDRCRGQLRAEDTGAGGRLADLGAGTRGVDTRCRREGSHRSTALHFLHQQPTRVAGAPRARFTQAAADTSTRPSWGVRAPERPPPTPPVGGDQGKRVRGRHPRTPSQPVQAPALRNPMWVSGGVDLGDNTAKRPPSRKLNGWLRQTCQGA